MDLGIVNHASLGPESRTFRAIHRPEAPSFWAFWRRVRVRAKKGGCRLRAAPGTDHDSIRLTIAGLSVSPHSLTCNRFNSHLQLRGFRDEEFNFSKPITCPNLSFIRIISSPISSRHIRH
jgi:hypothetical protein